MDISLQLSKAEKYPARQHAEAVARELGCQDGLVYLLGQYLYPKEDSDMPKTWYQRRFFYYMSGVDEGNACLTYDCRKRELILYIEKIDWDRVIWTGRGSTIEEAKERYDVDDVRLNPQLFPDIRQWLKHGKGKFYTLHEDHVPKDIDGIHDRLETESLMPAMDICRAIKDPYEIKLIEHANDISDVAHRAVLSKLATATNEAQLSAVFQDVCISHFAVQAYDPIVGSGANASTLHYTANNANLSGRQLICLDAGAAHELYASDVTRTFPINGQWTKEAREIYDMVAQIQDSCIAMCKPGVHMIDLHKHCQDLVIRGLLKLGILHGGTPEEIFKAGTSSAWYMHGLGHHLGLETHDCQSLPILRYRRKTAQTEAHPGLLDACRADTPSLKAGMVVTIEPGVYFNREHVERNFLSKPEHAKYINQGTMEKYYAVGGVRIEDDILITEKGYKNLTTAPKGNEALEIIREGYFDDLYSKIEDWYGLDHKAFGKLARFTTVKASVGDAQSWSEYRAYLMENVFLLVQEVHDRDHEEEPRLEHLGLTGSVEYKLRGSLLVKKHLAKVSIDPEAALVLRLSTKEHLPDFNLQFEETNECREWGQAFRDAML